LTCLLETLACQGARRRTIKVPARISIYRLIVASETLRERPKPLSGSKVNFDVCSLAIAPRPLSAGLSQDWGPVTGANQSATDPSGSIAY